MKTLQLFYTLTVFTALSLSPVSTFAANSEGSFDAVNSTICQVAGWAHDPDSDLPIQVHIYKDGPYGIGSFVTAISANQLRADLPFTNKNFGFLYTFEPSSGLYDGKDHPLYIYAIDTNGNQNSLLNSSPKIIRCAATTQIPAPVVAPVTPTTRPTEGSLDVANNSLCQISGWARDPDSVTSIRIDVYRDGPFGTGTYLNSIIANLLRSDLPFTNKNLGFIHTFETNSGLYDGKPHTVYLYAIDATGDSNSQLNSSPGSLTCPAPVVAPTIVNVKDYGAKGDGLADDAPAIQKAIKALSSLGGTVNIPSGTYMLGSSAGGIEFYPNGQPIENAIIVNKPNVLLKGSGSQTVLKLMPHSKMRAITVTGNNVTVDGIVIDGNKTMRNESNGWPNGDVVDTLFAGSQLAKSTTIKNCEVKNGIEDGIGFWKSDDAVVDNCYIHDNGTTIAGGAGVSLSGGARAKTLNSRIENNTAGIWVAFGSQDIKIQNNTIKNNDKAGITIGGYTAEFGAGNNSGFTVSGNTISGNGIAGFDAVIIASASNGVITDNTIINNAYDSLTVTDDAINPPSTNWMITNNLCSNTDGSGTQKWGIRIQSKSNNIVLRNNTCKNNGLSLADQITVDKTASVNSDWQSSNTLQFGGAQVTTSTKPKPTLACTMDAFICPDGTALGRTGPNCSFPSCSTMQAIAKTPQITGATNTSLVAPTVSPKICQKITRYLTLGSSGADVIALQKFLSPTFPVKITGVYGMETLRAVQRYQSKNGIISSGSPLSSGYGAVGPKTRLQINSNCSSL